MEISWEENLIIGKYTSQLSPTSFQGKSLNFFLGLFHDTKALENLIIIFLGIVLLLLRYQA